MKRLFVITLLLCLTFSVFSQQQDSIVGAQDSIAIAKTNRSKTYSVPRRASLMSAILPGLGQAYNGKYWKIPVIYAGFVGFGYMFKVNNEQYNFFRKNLIAENDEDPSTINETRWGTDELQTQKVTYRKRRDIAAVGVVIIYILNIIDANVDAHLKTFDVSDDLSLRIEPWPGIYAINNGFITVAGLSLKLNFK